MQFITLTGSLSWVSSKTVPFVIVGTTEILYSIVVEFAKESRPRRDVYEGERNHGYEGRTRLYAH
jgi:hypothetical protein